MSCTQRLCSFITVGLLSAKFGRGLDFFEFFKHGDITLETKVFGKGDEEDEERENGSDDGATRVVVPLSVVLEEEKLIHARHEKNAARTRCNRTDAELFSILLGPKPPEERPLFAHVFTDVHQAV